MKSDLCFMSSGKLGSFVLCTVLFALVWLLFFPVLSFDFVNYDDNQYVYANSMITNGVSWEGIRWVATNPHSSNWHPLTSVSHMLDCELFGLNPGGHHLGNVMLHALNAMLLFVFLNKATGSLWRSFFVVALFAVHPLRVESVAWVSERKDVLSGFFFMLTLLAYLGYVKRCAMRDTGCGMCDVGEPGARGLLSSVFRPLSSGSYWLVVLFFTLGLMSKPMLVTLPFVLLLLDFWPLGRFGRCGVEGYGSVGPTAKERKKETQQPTANNRQPFLLKSKAYRLTPFLFLMLEKTPLFILSAIFCVITVWAQKSAIVPTEGLSFSWRAGNAFLSYVTYVWQTFFPFGLTVFYPLTGVDLSWWRVGGAFLFLVGITALVFRYAWKSASPNNQYQITNPSAALAAGWLWYIGMLVPVIGLFKVGEQAHADRYTYLPQIGLIVVIVWSLGAWAMTLWRKRLVALLIVTLCGLMATSRVQLQYWHNSLNLWSRAKVCSAPHYVIYSNLGTARFAEGDVKGSIESLKASLRLNPERAEVWNNLSVAYAELEQWEIAFSCAQIALVCTEKQQVSEEVFNQIQTRVFEYQVELNESR
jgi:hypothetical protein